MSGAALYNGAPAGEALVRSRGLQYGDGVFRTLLLDEGRLLDWELQMQHLARDCRALGLAPAAPELLEAECLRVAGGDLRAVLKVILTRASTQRGYAPASADSDRLVSRHPAPGYPASHWKEGIAAFRSPVQLAQQPLLAGIKHLNRLEQVLASRDWPEGVAEAILCDHSGNIIGGSKTNIFWARNQRLHTPMLSRAGVNGVMKNKVMALARADSIETAVQDAGWQELEQADEVFVTNSLIGIWPVRILHGRQLASPGPLTRRCMELLRHPMLCA